MTRECPDPSIAQYLMAVSQTDPQGELVFPLFDRPALIETIRSVRDVSVRDWLIDFARRGKPVLVLRGAESLVWSHGRMESEKTVFAGIASVAFEEVPDTGHGLPFEKRGEFVTRLTRFFSKDIETGKTETT